MLGHLGRAVEGTEPRTVGLDDADPVHLCAASLGHRRLSLQAGARGHEQTAGYLLGLRLRIDRGGGDIFFYLALQAGADTAIALPLTNVYPLVTIVIAYFWFKERLNLVQARGILIALTAITLLSGEAKNLGGPLELLRRVSLNTWMLYSFGAMVCWGVFSATQKVSTNHVSAEMSYLAWCAAFIPIAICIVATKPLNWHMSAAMVWSGLAVGALNGFGVIAAFAAYRYEGKAAIVTPLAAAVQPLVTVVLALLFLGERVGLIEGFGIVLAICAAVALSPETQKPADPQGQT